MGLYNWGDMRRKPGFKDIFIEKMRRMDGITRWEIAAEKWQTAKEFSRIGKRLYGAKGAA
jgi:hypothetical protein